MLYSKKDLLRFSKSRTFWFMKPLRLCSGKKTAGNSLSSGSLLKKAEVSGKKQWFGKRRLGGGGGATKLVVVGVRTFVEDSGIQITTEMDLMCSTTLS